MPATGRVARFSAAACAAVLGLGLLQATAGAAPAIPVEDKAVDVPLTTSDTPDQPDIVIIYTDDQRKGSEKLMPQVQRLLARQGVSFTDAHTPTSTCCPSRVSLITGRLANETGVWTNWPPYGGFEAFMSEIGDTDTIATRLDDVGYRTALVGKYMNGYADPVNRKTYAGSSNYIPPGWDVWHTYGGPASVRNPENSAYYDYWLMSSEDGASPRYTYYGEKPKDYSTRVLGARAVATVEQAPADEPLFLLFTPNAPHSKYLPDPKYKRAPVEPVAPVAGFNDVDGKPAWLKRRPEVKAKSVKKLRADQVRTLMSVDDVLVDLVGALEDRGTLSNTLLVFASDNGYTWGEFRLLGTKNTPYTTPIPLIMRWDEGGFTGGGRDSRLTANIDITRTALAAAGADTAGLQDSLDLADADARRKQLVIAAWRNRGDPATLQPAYCGLRTRGWLYTRYTKGRFEELYDLRRDPHMLVNLVDDAAVDVHLQAMQEATRTACDPIPPSFSWE
jgi:N-acetylglucosamine-6-sulfatase